MVGRLDFHRGAQVELAVEALFVLPPHAFEHRKLDLFHGAPGPASAGQLGLVEVVDCFGEGVVIGLAGGPGRRGRAAFDNAIRVDQGHVNRPVVRLMRQPGQVPPPAHAACSSACRGRMPARSVATTFQPTIQREKTSVTEAT